MTESRLMKFDGKTVSLSDKRDGSTRFGVVDVTMEEWVSYYRGVMIKRMHAGFYLDEHHGLKLRYYSPQDLKYLTMEAIK